MLKCTDMCQCKDCDNEATEDVAGIQGLDMSESDSDDDDL